MGVERKWACQARRDVRSQTRPFDRDGETERESERERERWGLSTQKRLAHSVLPSVEQQCLASGAHYTTRVGQFMRVLGHMMEDVGYTCEVGHRCGDS